MDKCRYLALTQICLKKFSHSRVMFLTSDLPVQPVAGASAYCEQSIIKYAVPVFSPSR